MSPWIQTVNWGFCTSSFSVLAKTKLHVLTKAVFTYQYMHSHQRVQDVIGTKHCTQLLQNTPTRPRSTSSAWGHASKHQLGVWYCYLHWSWDKVDEELDISSIEAINSRQDDQYTNTSPFLHPCCALPPVSCV